MTISKIHPQSLDEYIVFIIGVFSTFQLTEIAGITVFSALILVYTIYTIMRQQKLSLDNSLIKYIILCSVISEIGLFLSGENMEWYSKSIRSYILFLMVYILYLLIGKKFRKTEIIFRGIYISCLIQVIWAVLQFILFNFAGQNLNQIVFERFLHMSGDLYQIKGNVFGLSGLNSNVGMMNPILIFLLVFSSKTYIRIIVTVIACISGSSTPIIAVSFYWVLSILLYVKKNKKSKYFLYFVVFIISILVIIVANPKMLEFVFTPIRDVSYRLHQALTGNFTDGSTFAHTRYYTMISYIIYNESIFNTLLGYGFSCAGIPYVKFFNQYSGSLWVPESDFVTYLFNIGIIGLMLFYIYLFKGIIKSYSAKETQTFIFLMCIVLAGLFYGIQLNWVLLVEYILINNRLYQMKEIKPVIA